jgi:energy-coupling factor transporter ATP-binding protein EcfA2
MAEEIKICKLILKDFDQFKDIELDFTDPKTGEPLEKICFIGRNGTGKSKILKVIENLLTETDFTPDDGTIVAKFKVGLNSFYYLKSIQIDGFTQHKQLYYKSEIEDTNGWVERLTIDLSRVFNDEYLISWHETTPLAKSIKHFLNKTNQKFIVINCPPEDEHNPLVSLSDVPYTTLGQALHTQNRLQYHYQVSPTAVTLFWERLMYLIEVRRQENEKFEQNNLDKTKRQLIEEFDRDNPKILEKIAIVWNQILSKAGLEFDVENAKIPIYINENLQAYLRLKNSKERINYSALSTGIRNFIFKLGHIYSLYFDKEITSGVLLLDEPENSLYPDFLYDLIDIYKQATTDKRGINNTQLFVATHSPIIAAQFKPEERIILDFDDDGGIVARRGTTPEGDDPNDVLKKDFEIRSLLGKKGVEKWQKFLELRSKLRKAGNTDEANEWRKELMKIGEEYNFPIS